MTDRTWLDEAMIGKFQVPSETAGLAAELRLALADRAHWLAERGLFDISSLNEVAPRPEMMRSLRQRETAHVAETLSRQLNAIHVPHEPGSRVSGVYERAITTPMGKLAVIRCEDTFTLAPWKPALEPMRGRAVRAPDRAHVDPLIAVARSLGGGERTSYSPNSSSHAR